MTSLNHISLPTMPCMNVDVKRVLTAFDLELPEVYNALDPNDFDQIAEAEYSYRRDGSPAGDAEELAIRAGCYMHTPCRSEGVHHISDLRADDLVRMDVIWLENG